MLTHITYDSEGWLGLACVPPVPWQINQHYAMKSGVHICSKEGEVVYANQSFLSISASKPGKRLIQLPGRFRLKELLGAGVEYKQGKKIEIDLQAESCRFFRIIKEQKS